ncbi:MAG: RbsD/FucU family protein [Tepidisphaeraceae bacterium]|jgi:L-fucose mutarotase
MLKHQLLHPQIMSALARAGHSSKILISDGNYPHYTKRGPNAEMVYLNLAPGQVLVTDVLKALCTAVQLEAAGVMDYARTGPYALKEDPPIWNEFSQILHAASIDIELTKIERFKFYETAGGPDITLAIATGDQRIYANLLLTIGVVMPPK